MPSTQINGTETRKRENLYESAMIALKTIIAQLPAGATSPAPLVTRTAVPLLVMGVTVDSPTEPLNACLESLSEVLGRFGDIAAAHHDEIQTAAMAVLQGGKPTSRKRAIHCLGALYSNPTSGRCARVCAHAQATFRRTCRWPNSTP